MKKHFLKFLAIASLAIIGCQTETIENSNEESSILNKNSVVSATFTQTESSPIKGQYIVILNNGVFNKATNGKGIVNYESAKKSFMAQSIEKFSKAKLEKSSIINAYGFALEGFTAKLNDAQLKALRDDPRVTSIEQDYYVVQNFPVIKAKPAGVGNGNGNAAQEIPYGITRVGGGQVYTGSKTAWVIDSGIDLDHPDLNVDAARSASYVASGGGSSPDDQHGHGTHVAGTIGAIDNSIGVVGVAAGVNVVAVRVVDRRGSGAASWCVSGVDYVAANAQAGDVANMSLGYPANPSIDQAVINASNLGIEFALAAGNDGTNAATGPSPSPARVNGANIYTVSAMDINDNFASFSNYGEPPVDYCAPGVAVKSCWKGAGYSTISGTSMASPHMAGLLIWGNVSTSGFVNGDPDGNPDPIAHR
jgi:subtilisin family serine protease